MSRPERLLALLQVLRAHRRPVSGETLAGELGISMRTLYRDIASLQAQGAAIEGERGMGYVMKPGFMLPPLMFSHLELEVLLLGMRMISGLGDPALAQAALSTVAKVSAVLPPETRRELESSTLLSGAGRPVVEHSIDIKDLRAAIRAEQKLNISYCDPYDKVTQRVVWPYALVYFDQNRVLMCWCELRGGFRNFRTDRIRTLENCGTRYPKNRRRLLREWREAEHVAGRSILPEIDSFLE